MPLNDDEGTEFDAKIEDEDGSIYPPPATEIGTWDLARDCGSGSYAEDGPLEVAEDEVIMDGEKTHLGNWTEIGVHAPTEGKAEIGSAAMYGPTEIGTDEEIGSAAMYGPTEIGVEDEIGEEIQAPFESFMLGPTRIGDANTLDSHYEIGAVAKVVEKARDNRQAPPPMKVVDADAELPDTDLEDFLTEILVGCATHVGGDDPFPLMTEFMQRCGADMHPRYVRVDTEESYKNFRTEQSPELAALAQHVQELEAKIDAHMIDPHAHEHADDSDLSEDIDMLVHIGAETQGAEAEKQVDLWMPNRFNGEITAWREGDFVCASLRLPEDAGEVRICTSIEPIKRCVEEMAHHADESGVHPAAIMGVLPAMSCVLGAGTILKEVAAAAPEIVKRPEMSGKGAFMIRVEPKQSPAISALTMLAIAAKNGDQQAVQEWAALAQVSPTPIKQAMSEALNIAKTVIRG